MRNVPSSTDELYLLAISICPLWECRIETPSEIEKEKFGVLKYVEYDENFSSNNFEHMQQKKNCNF